MTALILAFVNRLPAVIVGPVVAALVLFGAYRWNSWVHDPAVRRAALAGYVKEVELVAANSRADELLRQLSAGAAASIALTQKFQAAQADRDAATQKLEQEIADHEKLGNTCPLTLPAIDWLHQ
jgi:hypothetical protein